MILKRKASSDCSKMLPLVRKDHENDLIHPIMGHLTTLEGNLSYYFPFINTEK